MLAKIIKIIASLGFLGTGTGLGLGMDNSGAEPWQIGLSVLGLFLTWLLTTKWALWYYRVKAFLHELNDTLADDVVEVQEVKDLWEAWKTGKIQPDK